MECLVALFVLVVAVAGPLVYVLYASGQAEQRERPFKWLALKYRARLQAGMFRQPRVRIRHGAGWIHITRSTSSGRVMLEFTLPWREGEFSLEVFSDDSPPEIASAQEVQLGEHGFRSQYRVRTSNVERGRRFLTEMVQWQLHKLRHLWGNDHVHLILHRRQLLIRKALPLDPRLDLEPALLLVLDLFGMVQLAHAEGITFLEDTPQVLENVHCQMCGDTILEDMVVCTRCKTPHHGDCWHYVGRCSTYGCAETTYVAVHAAQRNIEPPHEPELRQNGKFLPDAARTQREGL